MEREMKSEPRMFSGMENYANSLPSGNFVSLTFPHLLETINFEEKICGVTKLIDLAFLLKTNGMPVDKNENEPPFAKFLHSQLSSWSKIPSTMMIEVQSGKWHQEMSVWDFASVDWIVRGDLIHLFEEPVKLSELIITILIRATRYSEGTGDVDKLLSLCLEDDEIPFKIRAEY